MVQVNSIPGDPLNRVGGFKEVVFTVSGDYAYRHLKFEAGAHRVGDAPADQPTTSTYSADRELAIRRDGWGFVLGLIGTVTLYVAYGWIAMTTVVGRITLGQMTMYLMLFRQGQAAVSASLSAIGGMYEDNLYMSNLYEFLDTPTMTPLSLMAFAPLVVPPRVPRSRSTPSPLNKAVPSTYCARGSP